MVLLDIRFSSRERDAIIVEGSFVTYSNYRAYLEQFYLLYSRVYASASQYTCQLTSGSGITQKRHVPNIASGLGITVLCS